MSDTPPVLDRNAWRAALVAAKLLGVSECLCLECGGTTQAHYLHFCDECRRLPYRLDEIEYDFRVTLRPSRSFKWPLLQKIKHSNTTPYA